MILGIIDVAIQKMEILQFNSEPVAKKAHCMVNKETASSARALDMITVPHDNITLKWLELFACSVDASNWLSPDGVRIFTNDF